MAGFRKGQKVMYPAGRGAKGRAVGIVVEIVGDRARLETINGYKTSRAVADLTPHVESKATPKQRKAAVDEAE